MGKGRCEICTSQIDYLVVEWTGQEDWDNSVVYKCPECQSELTRDDDVALKILNGEVI